VAVDAKVRSIATSALAMCLSGAALAAELPPPPAFTWSGLYIGFNYGYAWKGDGGISTLGAPLFDTTVPAGVWPGAAALGGTGFVNARLNGFFGGAQLGYNWQLPSRIVIGVEADIQGGGIRGGGGFSSVLPGAAPGSIVVTSGNSHRTLEHFGTARARLGYAVTPTVMGYLTGGLAYGGVNLSTTINQTLNPSLLTAGNSRADLFRERMGWTIGFGAETAIAQNLSAKIEYLHYDLGRQSAGWPSIEALVQTNPATGAAVATATRSTSRIAGNLLRTGLNYRFGGQTAETSAVPTFALLDAASPRFGDWSASLTPYIWGVGMNGSTTALGHSTEMNVSFVDALTKSSSMPLEFAANMELRNGPLSFYADFAWMQMRMAGSLMALRNPIAGAVLSLDADARLKTTLAIVEGGATFEMGRWGYAGAQGAFTAVDAVAGLRYWRIGLDLALNIAGAVNLANLGLEQSGGKAIARSGDLSWVDPFVGLRLRQQVDAANAFYLKGDVGGFGVGSKFAWQAAGGYTHDFQFAGLNWTGMVGYRALRADYTRGEGLRRSGVDMIMHGPMTGLGVRF